MSDDGEREIGAAVGERDMSDDGERKPLYLPNGINIHVEKESIAKGLDIASWLVAAIVSVAILVVLFGNEETLAFSPTAAFGSAGYLLALFLHFKAKSFKA